MFKKMFTITTINTIHNNNNKRKDNPIVTSGPPLGNTRRPDRARPYSEIPGPRALPFIGNSWRFAPIIGK